MDLIKQARKNIGSYARIARVIVDWGFMDGPTLHEIDAMGIEFIIPAKDNMRVYEDARSLAKAGYGNVSIRTQTVHSGYGRHRTSTNLTTEVIGIESLSSYDQ